MLTFWTKTGPSSEWALGIFSQNVIILSKNDFPIVIFLGYSEVEIFKMIHNVSNVLAVLHQVFYTHLW